MPASGELLAGRVGQRAVLQTADGERRLIGVTAAGRFGDARVLVSRSHRPPRIEALQRRLGVRQLIPCGSAGVKVTRIARGEAELYVHAGRGLASWDCCAPEAILSAAGGRMTDLQGHTLRYLPNRPKMPGGVIASNGVLHPGALSAVPWAIREERRLREHQAEASPAPGEDESGSSR
jgi:3'(2'), 5'-bisphosphate nucleotidase